MPDDHASETPLSLFDLRRSVGDFDPGRPIPEDLFREIVRRASLAPSASNLQPWRIIAVRSPEARRRLHAVARQQARILSAPVTLIVVGDRDGYLATNPFWDEMAVWLGVDRQRVEKSVAGAATYYGESEETRARYADTNAALFAMSLMYAAKSVGVDSHPMGGIDHDGVARAFSLRPSEHVSILISLGYRDESKPLRPRRRRRTYDELVEEA